MSAWKSKQNKTIKSVKLLGVRTAKETMILSTVNYSVYSFYIEYTDGTAETIEVSPQNPNDKRGKEKAVFDNLMRLANTTTQDNIASGNGVHQTMSSSPALDSSKIYDNLKKIKDLLDAGVITQDVYGNQRQKLLFQLETTPVNEIKQREYNITIHRKKGRPFGEGRTILLIDKTRREDIDLDMVCRLLLPKGTHKLCFERSAVKSKVCNITITEDNEYDVEFNPHTFSIDVKISEK